MCFSYSHSRLFKLEIVEQNITIKELKSKVSEEIGCVPDFEGNSNFQAQINWFRLWENSLWTMKDRFRCLISWRSLKDWEIMKTSLIASRWAKNIQSYIHLGQDYPVKLRMDFRMTCIWLQISAIPRLRGNYFPFWASGFPQL